MTAFGETSYFRLYSLIVLLFSDTFPTLLLIILNIVTVIKLKLTLSRMAQTSFLRQVEINLVRLVLILTFICIFTRVFDTATSFLIRFNTVFGIELSEEAKSWEELLKQMAYFCLFAAHALDGIFCYLYDRHLKYVACQLIRMPCKKFVEYVQERIYSFV